MPGKVSYLRALPLSNRIYRFTSEDIICIERTLWSQKLQAILDKTSVPLNIVLDNQGFDRESFDRANKRYMISDECKKELFPDYTNRVNVILTCNGGTNRLPMTPWISIHRAVHAMQLNVRFLKPDGSFEYLTGKASEDVMWKTGFSQTTNLIAKCVKEFEGLVSVEETPWSTQQCIPEFARLIGDTRTLRTGKMLNDDSSFAPDFWAEIFTEQIVKGRMTIRVEAFDERFKGNDRAQSLIQNVKELKENAHIWFEQMINNRIGQILVL
jgi:hypothetical protein